MTRKVMKNAEPDSDHPELFAIAKITGCFGIKGFVKVLPFTHSPNRMKRLKTVLLGIAEQATSEFAVETVKFQSNGIVMKFKEYDDRTAAEHLVGRFMFIHENELVKPPKGSWFIHQIIGCDVFLEDGSVIGKVLDVWKMPGTDLWEIGHPEKSVMFPASKDFIVSVDVKKSKIVVAPPNGLLEI